MIKNCDWSCSQVVIYKTGLVLIATTYIFIGSYFFLIDLDDRFGNDDDKEKFQNYMILYAFANFVLYSEFVSKMSDYDRTDDFGNSYILRDPED